MNDESYKAGWQPRLYQSSMQFALKDKLEYWSHLPPIADGNFHNRNNRRSDQRSDRARGNPRRILKIQALMLFSRVPAFKRLTRRWTRSISFSRVDHVCLVVRDVRLSVAWYQSVLNMRHDFKDHPSFGYNPAFMRSGDTCLALLPLNPNDKQIRYHNGAHVAFTVSEEVFAAARAELPGLLTANKGSGSQDVNILEEDYGIQKSIFFKDPDNNILELTYWVDESEQPDKWGVE